jgi:Leucine-rich repeat (LRR) protein
MDVSRSTAVTAAPISPSTVDIPAPASDTAASAASEPYADNAPLPPDQDPPLRGRQQLALIVGADALEELGGAPALHSPRELAALGGRLILEHTLHGDDDIRTGLLVALAEGVHRMRGQASVRGDYDGLAEQLHAFLETEFKEEFAVSHAAWELARLGVSARPEPAGERSEGVDPDAGASQRWDRDIGVAADRTVELVDAWLSCIAAQHGLDLGAAVVEIATARLQYYRREAPASPGAAFVYVDMDDAPAPGYIATLHASTGLRRFFLCVQDGSVLPMVTAGTDGTVAYDVAANDVSVSGSAAHEGCAHGNTASGDATDDSAAHDEIGNWLQRHAHIIFGPQDNERRVGEHARVVLDTIAQGPRNELAQWLAPVLRSRFDKAPEAARGQAQAAVSVDAPPHFIPFRRALVATQHNGIDTALASGGVDVTAFAIPMLCSALCVAVEAGRASGPLARASGRGTVVDVGPGERAAAAGPADLRTGIRAVLQAALKAVNTTAPACVPLPLDVDAVAEALRPCHPQLAFALQQAARRESGPSVADGRRRVIGPPGVRPDTVTHRIGDHKATGLWRQADLPGSSGGSSRGGGTSGLSGLRYQSATQSTFHDLLASCIRGNASPGQVQSFRQLLEKLQANPGGKAILRAMQAQHELLGEAPEIELRSGNDTPRRVGRSTWSLDPDALNAASIDDAVRELAAVYNNMSGVLRDVDCFAGLIASGKPELDPQLEQAWQRWLALDPSRPRRAIDRLRLDLRTARCYGGMDKGKLRNLLSLGYIDDETSLGLNVRLPPGAFTAVPPLPDEVEVLDVSSNPIQEWSNLPRGLKVLIARKTSKSVLEHLHLTPGLIKLDVSDNGLHRLPATLSRLGSLKQLLANDNYLCALPALPGTIETLVLRHNRFRNIPRNLPEKLKELDLLRNQISGVQAADLPSFLERLNLSINRLSGRIDLSGTGLKSVDLSFNEGLRELPISPPTLTSLDAEECALETLPDSLPGLERLHVPYNRIRQVPRNLPSTLRDLRLAHNPIEGLRQDDLDRLTRGEVSLENNPILFRRLSSWTEGGPAPHIHFSMPGGGLPAASVSSTLAQAVAHWLGQDSVAAANWANIGQTLEGGSGDAYAAQAFRLFLDRLRATVSFKNADFRSGVREWLVELSRPERISLRESSMQLCIGATERCEDYVARVLNDLKAARLHDDIRLGRYDERVGEALDAMRQTFRRACLQDIAYRKIKSLQAVDDVEVYLAYEVKLREQLGLSTVVPDMRFFNASSVDSEDLEAALKEAREAERTGFYKYLVLDDTWHALLKRKLGARYREAESRLEGLVNGGSLQERVRAELRKRGQNPDSPQARLYNDPKLEREVWDEMRYDVLEPLTRDLLANAGVPLSAAGVAGPSVGSH